MSGTEADGRKLWLVRHPAPIGDREFETDDVKRGGGVARGAALYARRRGNRSAAESLIEAAAAEPPDNLGPDAA